MIIAQLAPSQNDRAQAEADGRKLPFDRCGQHAYLALQKCKNWVFPNSNPNILPTWLAQPLAVLDLSKTKHTSNLHQIVHLHDLVPQLTFFANAVVHPPLDHIVQQSNSLHHLAASLH